jgi:hypothetical protein
MRDLISTFEIPFIFLPHLVKELRQNWLCYSTLLLIVVLIIPVFKGEYYIVDSFKYPTALAALKLIYYISEIFEISKNIKS